MSIMDEFNKTMEALQKIVGERPLVQNQFKKVWHSDDFESKEDFIAKVERNEVKIGDHFEGAVGKIIGRGAFVHLAADGNTPFGWFDGYIPIQELSWDPVDTVDSVVYTGMEIETVIKHINFTDKNGNDKFTVGLSLRDVAPREMPPANQFSQIVEEQEDFKPIDNSNVEVEEGNQLCIHPLNIDSPKLQKRVFVLNSCIKEVESVLGNIQGNSGAEKAQALINGVFHSGFDMKLYISNRSFKRNDGLTNRKIAVRVPRLPGDWLDTNFKFPVSKTLVFEGSPLGKELSVDKIFINSESSGRLPYEIEADVRICDTNTEVKKAFLNDLISNSDSVYEYTARQLTLWEEYLVWSREIAEHQIKGCKYVDVYYDSNKQRLVFSLISESKEEFEKVRKALKRNVQAYKNNYSSSEWKFIFDRTAKGFGEPIGLCDRNVVDEFYLSGNENKVFSSNRNDEKSLSISDIYNAFGESDPYIVKMSYDLAPDDKDLIQEQNLEDNELDEYIEKEVLPRYPKNGFLALSAVGDFSLIRRFTNAINQLKDGENYSPRLAEWIFDSKYARLPEYVQNRQELVWNNPSIESNQFQKEAVEKMLEAPDLFLLQGPPGTGKTTVIAEAIYQFVKQGKRVLLSSQSNDAVDNALERLANVPEIRALRIGGRKKKTKNADEELALNKFSEETALKYYYKSISSQISERMLDKWSDLTDKETELKTDKRDLRNYNKDITDLQVERGKKITEGTRLQEDLSVAKRELDEFNTRTSSIQNENIQYNMFLNVLNQNSETSFAFSSEQILLIKNDVNLLISKLKENGIAVVPAGVEISENNVRNSNSALFAICMNNSALKALYEKVLDQSDVDASAASPELLILEKQIAELEEKLNAECSDDEYDRLEREQNKLKRRKRELLSSGNSGFHLSTIEKSLCSETLLSLLNSDISRFAAALKDSIDICNESISGIRKKLEDRINENNKTFDSSVFNNRIDSIEGKIRNNTSEISDIGDSITRKTNTVSNMCKKYELKMGSTVEQIEDRINELIADNQRMQEGAKEVKEYWGDTLFRFKKKLDEHASDERLVQIDNDNYFKDVYVKACNVVGISCTANPKFLDEKDYTDFDVVIIDEVSKATPPELLIPLMKARKTILVGDHRQLPPMFKENINSYEEFVYEVQNSEDYDDDLKNVVTMENFSKYKNMVTASLFKEHFENAPESLKSSLLIQFRMHPDIMNIINRFYEGRLKCGIPQDKVELEKYTDENGKELCGKAHNLRIPSIGKTDFIVPKKHAYWIDSSKLPTGEVVEETHKGTSTSSCNYLEEEMAVELVQKIAAAYKSQGFPKVFANKSGEQRKETVSIGIISFYQMQVNDIRRKIKALRKKVDLSAVDIDVNTVDRFQGKEKQIIIVSLVRNKKYDARKGLKVSEHVLSFERINVAFSRAQNMLVILGAKNFYKSIEIKLPAMNSTGSRTTYIYQNIMQDLQEKGCFFDSSVLIDAEHCKEISSEINANVEVKTNQKFKNNYRGGKR